MKAAFLAVVFLSAMVGGARAEPDRSSDCVEIVWGKARPVLFLGYIKEWDGLPEGLWEQLFSFRNHCEYEVQIWFNENSRYGPKFAPNPVCGKDRVRRPAYLKIGKETLQIAILVPNGVKAQVAWCAESGQPYKGLCPRVPGPNCEAEEERSGP